MRRILSLALSASLLFAASSSYFASAAETPVTIATVSVESGPLGVAISPDGTFAYVSNFSSNNLSVLDLNSRTLVATVAGVNSPQGIAFTPDGEHAYVAIANGFARIATSTHSVVQTISGGLCTTPNQIVANPAGGAMYAACGSSGRGASIDTSTQSVSDSLANVSGSLDDVAIAPDGASLIWARGNQVWFQGNGALVTTSSAPTALATVQGINDVFTVNSGSGTLDIINNTTNVRTDAIAIGGTPQGIALSGDAGRAYVTDRSNDELLVVDLVAKSVLHRVAVGSSPRQVALTPDDRYAVVTNFLSNSISIVDLTPSAHQASGSGSTAYEIQFIPGDGHACTQQSIVGELGTWVRVPAADTCQGLSHDGDGVLLGWATRSEFPVDIAQRQVDNGWRAYETFDDQGLLTGVFIPAGGATAISSPGTLYAIWDDGPTT